MSPIVSFPYSQGAPNTCLALTEQFDPSPCVVIGGPGLVIHGPFDCWHVKCLVPIPKAESWFAGSSRFQLFDLWPRSYYWLLMHLQAAATTSGSPLLLHERCVVPDLLVRWRKRASLSNIQSFLQISGLSCVSCMCLLFCYVLKSFLFFFWGPKVQLICICPLNDIFVPAVRRQWGI